MLTKSGVMAPSDQSQPQTSATRYGGNVGSHLQTCIEGSNPSLSATQSGVQRNPLGCSPNIARNPRQFASFRCQTRQEKVLHASVTLDALPLFSDRQASSPVYAIPVGE